ncbi:LysR family transcriptional regulator [Providencia vermicola]|uniref:LysR family transcriptional regulator n=1 Tax=Providencia vermicola TaxID=333965 RepID=UPI003D294ADC
MNKNQFQNIDFNLIYFLHVLLDEGSVTGAAKKLHISSPAMSRALNKMREQFSDPIMVRAGKHLVPTQRALELKSQLPEILEQMASLFAPEHVVSPGHLERTFTIRANDIFIGLLSHGLLKKIKEESPNIKLMFIGELEDYDDLLRENKIDLLIGARKNWHPEIKVQGLFYSNFQAVVRKGHPILGNVSVKSLIQYPHIAVSSKGQMQSQLDEVLASLGYTRTIEVTLPSFHSALMMVMTSDCILPIPEYVLKGIDKIGLPFEKFELPFELAPIQIVQAWHPRQDNDPAHRWLRNMVKKFF